MRIGIIETGKLPPELEARHGDYPAMFERLLAPLDPALRFRSWAAVEGALPPGPEAAEAWLITGSKHGVYDALAWIAPLKAFLRAARAAGRPMIGVCFGHQILAEALGGRAVKSEQGWGVGAHDYALVRRPGWMAGAPERVRIGTLHQDQVVDLPVDATLLATSPFCRHAMLAYGDPEAPDAISVQPHPEFEPGFLRELIALRTGTLIPPERGAAALESLAQPLDRVEMARWVLGYLARVAARRDAA